MRSAPKRSLALIGDSILDNWPYTAPEPSTAMHLERLLGEEWEIRVVARDGSRIADVHDQLRALDGRPDLAVLSVGGNDAVPHIGLLNRPASNSSEVLDELVAIGDEFARRYEGGGEPSPTARNARSSAPSTRSGSSPPTMRASPGRRSPC